MDAVTHVNYSSIKLIRKIPQEKQKTPRVDTGNPDNLLIYSFGGGPAGSLPAQWRADGRSGKVSARLCVARRDSDTVKGKGQCARSS